MTVKGNVKKIKIFSQDIDPTNIILNNEIITFERRNNTDCEYYYQYYYDIFRQYRYDEYNDVNNLFNESKCLNYSYYINILNNK